jgi:16S rRNA processing protein RimM
MTSRSASRAKSERSEVAAQRVAAGRVVAAHGIRGEVAIEVLSDVPDRFAPGSTLLLSPSGSASPRQLTIGSVRPHKRHLLVGFDGVADRDAAEALRGAVLEVPLSEVPPPPADGYYWFDLEGCRCHDRALGDLGRVEEVLEGGGGVLLRVAGPRGELLLPFVDAYLLAVDVAAKRIDWALPEGLVDPEGLVG